MNNLPDELLMYIFNFLDLKSLVRFSSTCKSYNMLSKQKRIRLPENKKELTEFHKVKSIFQVKGWPNIEFSCRIYYALVCKKITDNSLYLTYFPFQNVKFSVHKTDINQDFTLPNEIYSLEYDNIDPETAKLLDKKISHISTKNTNPVVPRYSAYIMYSEITDLSSLSHLKRITLLFCSFLTDLRPLEKVENITLMLCSEVSDISCLGKYQKHIEISTCNKITEYSSLNRVDSLSLRSPSLTSFNFIGTYVQNLTIEEIYNVFDLAPLRGAKCLKRLKIIAWYDLMDIDHIHHFGNHIYDISILNCSKLKNGNTLSLLPNLKFLNIERGCYIDRSIFRSDVIMTIK